MTRPNCVRPRASADVACTNSASLAMPPAGASLAAAAGRGAACPAACAAR